LCNFTKFAPRPRQITMPASHHLVFYRPDALPATKPTVSKHSRYSHQKYLTPFGHYITIKHMLYCYTSIHVDTIRLFAHAASFTAAQRCLWFLVYRKHIFDALDSIVEVILVVYCRL